MVAGVCAEYELREEETELVGEWWGDSGVLGVAGPWAGCLASDSFMLLTCSTRPLLCEMQRERVCILDPSELGGGLAGWGWPCCLAL